MSDITVERLKIEVSADTKSAAGQLEALQRTIKGLQETAGKAFGKEASSNGGNYFASLNKEAQKLTSTVNKVYGSAGKEAKKMSDEFRQSAEEINAIVEKTLAKQNKMRAEQKAFSFSSDSESGVPTDKKTAAFGYDRDVMEYIDEYVRRLNGADDVTKSYTERIAEMTKRVKEYKAEIKFRDEWQEKFDKYGKDGESIFRFAEREMKYGDSQNEALGIKDMLENLGDGFTSLGKKIANSKILGSFERVIRYRVVSLIINQITDGLKEGMNNLYQYSKLAGTEFSANMDSATTSLQYFRNSLGAMAEPILNTIIPIFDSLIDKVVDGVNWLNQLFAVMSGSSSWTKAIRQEKEYAESATEAANASKRLLASFDQLHIIGSSSSSGGSGSSTDYSTMFEEMPIETVGDDVIKWAERFKEIFEFVKENAVAIGTAILTWKLSSQLLGGIDSLKDLKTTAGLTIAVASVALEYDAIKKLAAGEVTSENIAKAIISGIGTAGGLTLAIGSVAGYGVGLAVGLVAAVTVGLVAWKTVMDEKARNEYENSEFYKQIVEWNGDHERHLKVIEEIDLHFNNYETQIGDIKTSFAEAKLLMNEAFYINDKPIKTLEDTIKLQSILEQLESHGIELEFDGTSITTAKDDAYELLETTKELMLFNAYKDRLTELYGDFANAQIAYDESLENYESANRELVNLQTDLFNELSDTAKKKLDISEPADISLGKMSELYKTTARLGEKFTHVSNEDLTLYKQKYADLSQVINDTMGDQIELREDMTKIEKSIDSVSQRMVDAKTTTENVTSGMNEAMTDLAATTAEQAGNMQGSLTELKTNSKNNFSEIASGAKTSFSELEKSASSSLGSVGETFSKLWEKAKNACSNIADAIKGLFSKSDSAGFELEVGTSGHALTGYAAEVNQYANGGAVSGQLFIARDAGAELVGKVGGRTSVINNAQIIEGIEGGVTRGMTQAIGSASSSLGTSNSADIAEQNKLLREQNRLLTKIADKELTISPSASLGRVVNRSQKLADTLTGG